jgi:7,8-dihydropterin-6-yl-methyl-4-(beta-D-ribofuranosyl)aminobenzene 5'-phosphate synthase
MPELQPLDKLIVDVLIDNASGNYSSKPANVSSEFSNVVQAGAKEMSGPNLCCAQLGLSLMLTGHAGATRHKLLFDAGPEGYIFVRNCKNLGVTLNDVEAIAISHGHWDHMGALTEAIAEITSGNQRKVPCHVNPGMFSERGAKLKDGSIVPFQKVPSPQEQTHYGADVVNKEEERTLLDSFFYLSGEIPRVTSFEKGRVDHMRRNGDDQPWCSDPFLMDERYVAIRLRGKGLMVFSACSHAGIINVLKHLKATFAGEPIYGVFGGLHLVGSLEKIIPDTMEHLKTFEPKQIMPAHCTGWRALCALVNTFGEGVVVPSAVGNRYTFSA